jgi:long-chain acyl-CoA synthetase
MREFSVAPVAAVDGRSNLTDPVWHNAEHDPHTVQFSRPLPGRAGWSDVTCAEFRDEVAGLARGLVAAGVGPGDRVCLLSRTRYEWTLIDYAIWAAGAVTVPIYETSSAEQIRWILADSGAVACFVETDTHRDTVRAVREATPALAHLWRIDRSDGPGAVAELTAAGAAVGPDEVERRRRSRGADDIATIIYTSGTTGRPKGCVLTHRNIGSDIGNAIPGLSNLFHEGGSTLLFLPLAHSFARLIQIGVVAARVRTGHSPDVRNLAEDLASFQPSFVLAVPRVFEKFYNTARQRAYADGMGALFERAERTAVAYSEALDGPHGAGVSLRARHAFFDRFVYAKLRAALGGRCRTAISGGAPLGPRLGHFFRGAGITIYEGYGLTETSPACTVNLRDHIRIGTVGRPLPGVTLRVADDDEILVRGELVFRGYWNDEPATAEAKDPDGWFHTGDLGGVDEDGYLRITGRKKELIVTAGGKNVAPAVLEDRIRAHALVSQCVVIGDRRPFVAALVTIDEETFADWKASHAKPPTATVADLRDDETLRLTIQNAVDEANRAVSAAEAVREFRILPADFTEANGMLTPSLKVKRTSVAKEYADEIVAIYR